MTYICTDSNKLRDNISSYVNALVYVKVKDIDFLLHQVKLIDIYGNEFSLLLELFWEDIKSLNSCCIVIYLNEYYMYNIVYDVTNKKWINREIIDGTQISIN